MKTSGVGSFDLEIAAIVPEGGNWHEYEPLGIICAGIGVDIDGRREYFEFKAAGDRMTEQEAGQIVEKLLDLEQAGVTMVTWNGASFDYRVLAQESGKRRECAMLMMDHVDLMAAVVAMRGHYLSLDKALIGAGLQGKLHCVTLKSGEFITDMNGAKAPVLWAQGEHDAVLAYQKVDVMQSLELALAVSRSMEISWRANSGRYNSITLGRLYSVKECLALPHPDTSWMDNPPCLTEMVAWAM